MNTTIIGTQGVEATTFDLTLKASSLDWQPKSDTVGGMDTGIQMPRKKLLYRSDTRQPLGIVGADYVASDPKEFLQAQFEFAEFIKGSVCRVGFIEDRSRVFSFVKLNDVIKLPRELRKVGDVCQAYIYSTDGWDGGTPRRSRLFVERLKCANGMTSREIKADLWVSHTSGMAANYSNRWKKFLGEVRETVETVREQFARLAAARMTEAEATEFLKKLLPGESKRTETTRNELLGLFKTGEGNEGASRWDAYNAVTEYVTHHRTYRETETSSSAVNRFLGVLETDTLSNRALSLLLN